MFIKNIISGNCPNCFKEKIHRSWSKIREKCSICDFKFQENNGDNWFFLLFIDRALFIFPIVVGYYLQLSPYYLMALSVILLFLFLLFTPFRINLSITARYFLEKKFNIK
jgi:uncharacterized protein (DUF983 family)